MIALLAIAAVAPYAGFHARLHPFGRTSLYPFTVGVLKVQGFDVTSLLYAHREQLVNLMGFATEPGEFDPQRANLYVHLGKRTWVVDASGTVLFGKRSRRLTESEFQSLRDAIRSWLPRLEPRDGEVGLSGFRPEGKASVSARSVVASLSKDDTCAGDRAWPSSLGQPQSCGRPARAPKDTKVFYFGLLTNTSVPIDDKRIEELYDLTSLVRPIVPDILKILATEDHPSTRFSDNVRLKLVPPKGAPIMLDLEGNVVGLGRPHALSLETRRRLKRLLFSAFPDDFPPVRTYSDLRG